MNPLDTMSTDFHQHVSVPSGPGVEAIVARGRRRRRGRATANLTAVAAVMLGLGGAAVMAGRDPAHRVVAADDTAEPAAVDPRLSIDLDDAMSVLPRREAAALLFPTPVLEGWTVEPNDHQLFLDASNGPPVLVNFRLTNGADAVDISVFPSTESRDFDDTITRLGQTVPADRNGNGDWIALTWNEASPGPPWTDSMTIEVSATAEIAEAVAASVTFEVQPIDGPVAPAVMDIGTEPEVVLAGTTDGMPWRILEVENELVIELDGTSPEILSEVAVSDMGIAVEVISVSNNATQINLVLMPFDATASIETDGITVPLRAFDLDGDHRIAIAPIPAESRADYIEVTGSNDASVAFVVAPPPTGWHTMRYVSEGGGA